MSPVARRGSGQGSDVLAVAGPPGGLEASHVSARQSAQAASESHCAGHWPSEDRRPKRGGCWLCVWDLALVRWQFSSSGSLFLRSLARFASLLAYKFSLAFTSLGRAREREKKNYHRCCVRKRASSYFMKMSPEYSYRGQKSIFLHHTSKTCR